MPPAVGRSSPAATLSSVVFPAPLGPSSATTDRSGTTRSTSRSTGGVVAGGPLFAGGAGLAPPRLAGQAGLEPESHVLPRRHRVEELHPLERAAETQPGPLGGVGAVEAAPVQRDRPLLEGDE